MKSNQFKFVYCSQQITVHTEGYDGINMLTFQHSIQCKQCTGFTRQSNGNVRGH